MRIVLVGTVESTRISLEALSASGVAPVALFTLPPELGSRHSDYVDLAPIADRVRVPVVHVSNINDAAAVAQLRDVHPDYVLVIGWSQICRGEFLSIPRWGAIGYHPAALPQHRGRAVIPWTILLGCRRSASTLFWLDEGLDSGAILAQEAFEIDEAETAATLYGKHMKVLRRLLSEAVPRLRNGPDAAPRIPQNEAEATYCARRSADDALIEWTLSARDIWRLIRATGDPYPGAFTYYRDTRLTVWSAHLPGSLPYIGIPGQVQVLTPEGAIVQCGDGEHIELRRVQLAGGTPQPAAKVLKRHAKLGIDWVRLVGTPARERA